MLLLPMVMLLSSCEEPQVISAPVEPPAIPAEAPVTEAASTPVRPETGLPKEQAPPAVEARTLDSLNLQINDRPVAVEAPSGFVAAPDSGWLDSEPEVTGTGQEGLLPELFGEQPQEEPVSIRGKTLFNDDAQGGGTTLDGAQMSIEIKTD